jgi:Uncharacterized protein conserved in bacteria (DUF2334)/Domain of Unknown Function (DUF1080)
MKPSGSRVRFTRWLWLPLVCLLVVSGLSSESRPARAEAHTDGSVDSTLAPGAPSVLVINQESTESPVGSEQVGAQVEMMLYHFTPNVRRISAAHYVDGQLAKYDRVAVIGNDAVKPLPSALLEDLARSEDKPILWFGHGLDRLPVDTARTFGFTVDGIVHDGSFSWVDYKGTRYPAKLADYTCHYVDVKRSTARILATYDGKRVDTPYIVQGENLWYVNTLPAIIRDPQSLRRNTAPLVFADALHDFFGTSVLESRQALVRLEDVSVHIDPKRIIETVDYLYSQRVPFSMGVIPAQRFDDGSVVTLQDKPEFVRALRYAQDHGGTIILHGYHHTFGHGEDYEFWDEERDAPLANESWDMYARKLEDGIRILRDQGIEPRYWETPHYAASPLAYRVFSHYFSHAVENRDLVQWTPYPSGPDKYGQILIPETIGYINPADGFTVDAQLERAKQLHIVRDSWAVAYYHPASIPLSQLKSLVSGLRAQGYTFADLRAMPTEVRSDYQPGPLRRLTTWVTVDLILSLQQMEQRLEQKFAWWSIVARVPWTGVLVSVLAGAFFIRLRQQWRPAKTAQLSHVESGYSLRAPRKVRRAGWLAAIVVGGLALSSGTWLVGSGSAMFDERSNDPLRGWSDLDWTVKYDGYGEVGAKGGVASMKPRAAQKPSQTSAALALAGDTGWRNYSFTVKMRLQKQLRQNSPPNEWEAGWLFFRFQDDDRSYYLVHKTNGLELGKLVPPAGTGQVFLETTSHPLAQPERWHDYRIDVRGSTIRVYVDGKLRITHTDLAPIPRGRVGLYTEDAHVEFKQPDVRGFEGNP